MASWTKPTRPPVASPTLRPDLSRPGGGKGRGILRPDEGRRYFSVDRLAPSPELHPWVDHYWTVSWDLPAGTTYTPEVLTHPCAHLTVESGAGRRHGFALPASLLHGVVTRRFSIQLDGEGRVFGVRFRPGGIGAFIGGDASQLTDRVVLAADVLGPGAHRLQGDVLVLVDDTDRARVADAFLLDRMPENDRHYDEVVAVIAVMLADRQLVSVEALARVTGASQRTLQRLFRRYVGIGPKWVLQRFRLQDAVARIDSGDVPDLSTLALELGWYDQAHFGRDFTDVVGVSPGLYLRQSRQSRPAPGGA